MSDLDRYGQCTLDDDGCTTCGDRAVPVRVLHLENRMAEVADRLGNRANVATDFVPGVQEGDILMVHVGVAIGIVRAEPPSIV
ncbi:MAG: HypC/HybG/HupF family hydrogenase formation chaperone [Gemmatimonadota bacterium]|nr:HypC/HybG/HupF family hydrogenase formation chaperone [Gemmatimonadota bacterium]